MPLAITFPLSGWFRDLHPLEYVRAGRTKYTSCRNQQNVLGRFCRNQQNVCNLNAAGHGKIIPTGLGGDDFGVFSWGLGRLGQESAAALLPNPLLKRNQFRNKLKTISKNAYCNEIFVTLPRVLKNLICLLE